MNIQYTRNGHRTSGVAHRTAKTGPVLRSFSEGGFILPLVMVAMVILISLALGEMMASYNSRIQAVQTKSQTEAMLAAEAGYERAIFWMSQQKDILGALQNGASGSSGNINFGSSNCRYQVSFLNFIGARPVFRVAVIGTSGQPVFGRAVDVSVMQETTGWAMGSCTIPSGTNSTTGVYFGSGEVIETPVHINNQHDSPDKIDIYISGSPRFLAKVEMGESRKANGNDKYKQVMSLFENGISFDQPYVRITDETAVQSKIDRFRNSTANAFRFEPNTIASGVSSPKCSATQLEFFVQGGVGKVRITNKCTVKLDSPSSSDYNIVPGTSVTKFQTYNIYGYHYRQTSETRIIRPITDAYVTQNFGGYTSDPGGQIYVNGNVIIGGAEDANFTDANNMVVKGKITVVASGNIWIADSIKVDGPHDANGMPSADNPNILGLIAKGIIKVVDPGLSPASPPSVSGFTYRPIGIIKPGNSGRYLPHSTVVEAAITVGGGGWGAENVNVAGGRRVYTNPQDYLIVHGSISEAIRGTVGHLGSDGFIKQYYVDTRLMNGILPGDIWFSGKYIPAPAGWSDNRTAIH